MKKSILLFAFLLFTSGITIAQEAAKAPEETKTSPFSFSGYIDTYYFKNLNNPLGGSNLGFSGFERIFDQKEGQIQFGMAQTAITYTAKKSEAVIDLTFGPHGDLGNYGNVISPLGGALTSGIAIKQAYFSYNATEKLSFTAGQFGTHIGYEIIDAPANFNYSLSNLFGNGPFYHLGVKANYALSEKVGIMAGVVNGWDAIYDNNKYKSTIAQLAYSPKEGISIYLNWIGGKEDSPMDTSGTPAPINTKIEKAGFKQMVDLTAGFQLSDKFYVGVNAAYGTLSNQLVEPDKYESKGWGGAALYSNYAFCESFALGARFEHFNNNNGVQYLNNAMGGTSVNSATLTGIFKLADDHFHIKPEVRFDQYTKISEAGFEEMQQLEDSNGKFTKNTQVTVGLALIYKINK